MSKTRHSIHFFKLFFFWSCLNFLLVAKRKDRQGLLGKSFLVETCNFSNISFYEDMVRFSLGGIPIRCNGHLRDHIQVLDLPDSFYTFVDITQSLRVSLWFCLEVHKHAEVNHRVRKLCIQKPCTQRLSKTFIQASISQSAMSQKIFYALNLH